MPGPTYVGRLSRGYYTQNENVGERNYNSSSRMYKNRDSIRLKDC